MLKRLKYILNSYTDKELESISLWVNSQEMIEDILIEENNIDLITPTTEIIINGGITKEVIYETGKDK